MIYAIADIHGQLAELEAAHARIARDRAAHGDADALVVHLGDLVDRGPASAAVIALLREGIADGAPWLVLKGNHDRMFTLFYDDPAAHDPGLPRQYTWLNPPLGGVATLASYGVLAADTRPLSEVHAETRAQVPPADIAFLKTLPLYHETEDLILVHAGIRPGVALPAQAEDDLLWIRSGFLDDPRDHGRLIVHGHTSLNAPTHFGNRVDLDGGAGYGRPLAAAVFEGRDAWLLTETGRVPLRPE